MGEQLQLAPVFYTLVQLKFNPIAQMEKYVPLLQEELRRSGFPDFQQENHMSINIRRADQSEPEIQNRELKRWSFTDSKKTEGYLLLPDSIVYHTSHYSTYEEFAGKALRGLSLLHEIVDLAYIDRIGLRYLDAFSPEDGEAVDDYLTASLLGLSSKIAGDPILNHSFSETALQVDGGRLIARSIITDNGLVMPPDLVPLSLNLSEKFASLAGRAVVLDFDFFIDQRCDGVDLSVVRERMDLAHGKIYEAFKASVSTKALNAWK